MDVCWHENREKRFGINGRCKDWVGGLEELDDRYEDLEMLLML